MAEGGSKLSEEQIYECLKSFNVPVRMNDLKVPSREFVVRVFECFLKDLQIDVASHELRPWEAIKHIEEIDIYEEAQLLILLAMILNHIFSPSLLNITIKDIVEPKPKRTKKILNYVLVFWNYYLQKYARFCALEETFESERQRVEDILAENEHIDEKYNDLLKTLNSMEPSKEELSSIVNAKEEKATKLHAETVVLETDYEGLKENLNNLKKKIDDTNVDIVKAKERLLQLSELIISSPREKCISSEIQTLEEKIKANDAEVKTHESKYRETVDKLQFVEEFQKEMEKFSSVLNELKEMDEQLRETVKTIIDAQQNLDIKEDIVKRLQIDLERKENQKLQKDQKSAKVLLNNKKQFETLTELLKMNENEEEKVTKNLQFIRAAVTDLQDNIDSVSDCILEVIKKCKEADAISKDRKAQFLSKMREISDKFKYDCHDILEIIKKTFPGTRER